MCYTVAEIAEVYNGTVERDEHLWKMADSNQDGRLNEEEFLPFQHPEHSTVTVSHQYVVISYIAITIILLYMYAYYM